MDSSKENYLMKKKFLQFQNLITSLILIEIKEICTFFKNNIHFLLLNYTHINVKKCLNYTVNYHVAWYRMVFTFIEILS